MIHSYEDLMIDSPEDIVDNLIKMFNKYKRIFPDQKLQSISREGDDVMGFKEFMVANHLSVRFLLDLKLFLQILQVDVTTSECEFFS